MSTSPRVRYFPPQTVVDGVFGGTEKASWDETTNDDRACWAEAALRAFGLCTGQWEPGLDLGGPEDDGEVVHDLLCNLMHWLDSRAPDLSFDLLLEQARENHAEEVAEEEPS